MIRMRFHPTLRPNLGRVFKKAVSGYKILQTKKQGPEEIINRMIIEKAEGLGGEGEEKKKKEEEGISLSETTKFLGKIPEKTDLSGTNIIYPLIPPKSPTPFAAANIKWVPQDNDIVYFLLEPKLSPSDQELLNKIKATLVERLDVDFAQLRKGEAKDFLIQRFKETVDIMAKDIDPKKRDYLLYYVERDFIGMGKIEALLADPNIEDINCDGVGIPMFIYHRNPLFGNVRTNVVFNDADELDIFVNKLAQRCGKTISIAQPLIDASLPDGSRIQATLATDIARRGSNFCVKEAFVQMHDGSIENIANLFERWRNEYGSKFDEYGNEICTPQCRYATGVDKDSLMQEKGKVLQILKLPSPEKLVRVSFREMGRATSSLEVTENHQFHVLSEDGIKTVEASNLKDGLWVPVPAKIDVEANLHAEEFTNKMTDSLLISGRSKVYVVLDERFKKFVNSVSSKTRLKDIRRGKTGSIPLSELIDSIEPKGRSLEEFEYLDCILRDGSRGRGARVRMPLRLSEELAYFVGWVIGDGSLTRNNVSIDYGVHKEHGESLRRAIEFLFNIKAKHYTNYPSRLYINSKIVAGILHNIFGIPYGKKSRKVDVPNIIERSNKKIVASLLRGLFESDGTSEGDIAFTTYSKILSTKVMFLLSRFGIYSSFNLNGEGFVVYVPSAYYARFSKEIFSNKNIEMLVANQKSTKRSHMLPAFLVNLAIGSVRGKAKIRDLYKIVNISEMNRGGRISFRKIKELNEFIKKYGESDITRMIDRLTRGDLEFKIISKVEIFENKERSPVYDITCNPVSFYVGGKDAPLFVHDTIRRFTETPLTPIDLMGFKTMDSKMASFLWICIEYGRSILISGGTASGKTSLLNAVSLFIPFNSKIVSIEDTPEIVIPQPHWVPQVARQALADVGGEKVGEVDLFDLLKESLRQRPDYIIVGEVRGKEAYVLFQQISTGHPSLATIHADTVERLIDRMTTPPISLPPSLIEALDLIVFIGKIKYGNKHVRRIKSIYEVIGFDREKNMPVVNQVFRWDPETDKYMETNKSITLDRISKQFGVPSHYLQKEITQRSKVLDWMSQNSITNFKDVAKLIRLYDLRPSELLGAI